MSGRYAKAPQTGGAPADSDIPAVAYVRMSTDHQKYSTENQLDVIKTYAAARGLTILRVFEDSGRSGLRLDGREALQKLMSEVRSDQADFKAILVYDVSRWGRFQDADEGAYYVAAKFMLREQDRRPFFELSCPAASHIILCQTTIPA